MQPESFFFKQGREIEREHKKEEAQDGGTNEKEAQRKNIHHVKKNIKKNEKMKKLLKN